MKGVIGWSAAAALAVALGGVGYVYFAGGSGEPSTEITTPAIPEETSDGSVTFIIDTSRSTAVFLIGEVLRGEPNTVEGTTSEIGGQVSVDPADVSSARISDLVINGRTFSTGSSFRDRAIRGPVILNSADDEFEFITFSATSIDGLSGSAAVGDTLTFQVSGELTIKGTTREETFDVSVDFVDTVTIEGSATTTVLRDSYGIGIPSAPGVADVSNSVEISLVFVAASA